MRRRILPRLLAIGVLVLALAGCVRFQAELTVAPANTVDGTIVVAVLNSDDSDEGRESARASADEVATGLLGDLKNAAGVAVTDYESDDDYVGYELRLTAVPFEAFSGTDPDSLHFAREGEEIVFTGALDFTDQASDTGDDGDGDDSNLTVSITFPGAVSQHNGELSGTTVSWSTPLEERVEMSARSAATGGGGFPLGLIAGIGGGLLLLAVIVVVLVLVLRSRRAAPAVAPQDAAAAPVAPTVATPAAAPVATPAPAPAPAATAPVADPAAPAAPDAPAAAKPKTPRAPKTLKEPPAPTA